MLGIGIGLEYPLSANIISDFVDPNALHPSRPVVGIFSMQGIGNTVAPLVCLCLLSIRELAADLIWRFAFILAIIPSLFLVHFRWKLHKLVARQEALVEAVEAEEIVHMSPEEHALEEVRHKQSTRNLIGCCMTWFLFDIAFYGTALFSSVVLREVFDVDEKDPSRSELQSIALGTFVISLIGLPGYWASVVWVDRLGFMFVQIMGFTITSLIYLCIAFFYGSLTDVIELFVVLYGLSFFFSNFGPNATTFLIPTRVFPASKRTAYHGYAAAAGKVGAIVGTFGFPLSIRTIGIPITLFLCSFVSFLGLLCTIFLIKDPHKLSGSTMGDREQLLKRTAARSNSQIDASL